MAGAPRRNWQRRVEELGFTYHTIDGDLYWDESAWYQFTLSEIEELESATNTLHELCLQAVQAVIDDDRFEEFQIPTAFREWIRDSWNNDEPTVYGRFDFAWDGRTPPKLLEYNADTPTALFESAVVQWHWLEEVHPRLDQFNSLHERLIDVWKELHAQKLDRLSFAATGGYEEDYGNVTYLRDTAAQAGMETDYLDVSAIGFDSQKRVFVDSRTTPLDCLFKLYPWEWMIHEEFGRNLVASRTRWIEPPWKMLLSNKALLVVLWELFPDCPYLLQTAWEPLTGDYVSRPALSREGSNVQIVKHGQVQRETQGPYQDQPLVYQAYHPLAQSEGGYAVFGSWIVGDTACGLGIREDENPITHNLSRFLPHVIKN
ncbi:MAG: glutathionylspermidine synthase family protein [Planctomycetaceae bacterium]|nr:glutathionylspermidine synthase family protein [Planctomycetaceae bacterium]